MDIWWAKILHVPSSLVQTSLSFGYVGTKDLRRHISYIKQRHPYSGYSTMDWATTRTFIYMFPHVRIRSGMKLVRSSGIDMPPNVWFEVLRWTIMLLLSSKSSRVGNTIICRELLCVSMSGIHAQDPNTYDNECIILFGSSLWCKHISNSVLDLRGNLWMAALPN